MKLKHVGFGVAMTLVAAMSVGCGPGMSHRAPANAPVDVVAAMEVELSHTLVGTTTVTGADMVLPTSRMPIAEWRDDEPPAPPSQTWGVTPAPQPIETENPYTQHTQQP